MKERKRLADATAGRYRKARKKDKGTILTEFVESTGFARSYAALVLRNQGREVQVGKARVRGDVGKRLSRPGRGATYDEPTVKALVQVWRLMDYICGKRLAPMLEEIVERLLRHNELRCDAATAEKLSRMCRHDRSGVTARAGEISSEGSRTYAAGHVVKAPDTDAHLQ